MSVVPTVDIIIPVYNNVEFVETCLCSLLNQTYDAWHAILVDDGSRDGSADVCATYAARDKRFSVITLPENVGQAASRNIGMDHATADYILFLDADDALDTNLLKTMQPTSADVVQFGYNRVGVDGTLIEQCITNRKYRLTSACMRLYRRDWLMKNAIRFPEGMYYEDVIFSVRVWLAHPRWEFLPMAGYLYTLNPSSTTSKIHSKDRSKLMNILREMRYGRSLSDRLVIDYTRLRLQAHFMLKRS